MISPLRPIFSLFGRNCVLYRQTGTSREPDVKKGQLAVQRELRIRSRKQVCDSDRILVKETVLLT